MHFLALLGRFVWVCQQHLLGLHISDRMRCAYIFRFTFSGKVVGIMTKSTILLPLRLLVGPFRPRTRFRLQAENASIARQRVCTWHWRAHAQFSNQSAIRRMSSHVLCCTLLLAAVHMAYLLSVCYVQTASSSRGSNPDRVHVRSPSPRWIIVLPATAVAQEGPQWIHEAHRRLSQGSRLETSAPGAQRWRARTCMLPCVSWHAHALCFS